MTNKSNDDSQLDAAFYDANHSRIKTLLLLSNYLGDGPTEELVTRLLIKHRINGDPKNVLDAFTAININNRLSDDSTQAWHADPTKVIDCAIFLCAIDNDLFDLMIDRLTALAKFDDRSRFELVKAGKSLQARRRRGKPSDYDHWTCCRFVAAVDIYMSEEGLSLEDALFKAARFLRTVDGAPIDGELTYDRLYEIRRRTLENKK